MRSAVSDDLDLTTHDSETYRRCRVARDGDGSEVLARILPAGLRSVKELQFGVYHHRVMMVFSFDAEDLSLGRIRQMRQYTTDYARSVFDELIRLSSSEGKIRHIVAYPLVIVPKGSRLLRKEDRALRREGFSHLYSTTTTTFCVRVRSSRIPGDLRRHTLRVSVPGTIVYQAGRISKPLVNSILDAVYFGALYARADEEDPSRGDLPEGEGDAAATSEMTLGTHNRTREVVAMLKDRVATERRYEFEDALTTISILLALAVALFAGLALLHR